ncbi:MAG: MerR family transcriptional regulator [Akkermansia sp.]|nr:MerR family transcriptional regulator [Akkermansia sp.]
MSREFGLSVHTLRFYEKEGILKYVERTKSGRRIYGEASRARLLGVLLLKQAGVTIPNIKMFLDATTEGDSTLQERIDMMEGERKRLLQSMEDLRRGLAIADFFIDGAKKMLDAAKRGESTAKAFPYLTLEGVSDFPFIRDNTGKLEPGAPCDCTKA